MRKRTTTLAAVAAVLACLASSSSAFSWTANAPSTPPMRQARSVVVAAEGGEGGGCSAKQIEVCVSTYGKLCRRKGSMKTLELFKELAEGESLGGGRTPSSSEPRPPDHPTTTTPSHDGPHHPHPQPTLGTGVAIIEQQECMDECPMGPNIRLDEVRTNTHQAPTDTTHHHHRLEIHRLHCPNSSINHASSSELAPPPPSPATRWPPLPRVLGGMLNWTHAQTHAHSTLHLQDDRQIKNGIKTREQVAEILGVDP